MSALKGQDAVISVVGPTGFADQKKFIDAAITAGVKRFLPSEFSANTLSPAVLQLLPLFAQKKEVLDYLKRKEDSGLTWTAIMTSGLFDMGKYTYLTSVDRRRYAHEMEIGLQSGFLGYDLSTRTATIWDDGNSVFTMCSVDQLGHAVIATLEHPEKTANKHLYVASLETSQKRIVAALEEATGSKWTVNATTTKKEVSEGFERLGKGDFSGALQLVLATTYGNTPNLRANFARDEELANDLLGLQLESVEEAISRVLKGSARTKGI